MPFSHEDGSQSRIESVIIAPSDHLYATIDDEFVDPEVPESRVWVLFVCNMESLDEPRIRFPMDILYDGEEAKHLHVDPPRLRGEKFDLSPEEYEILNVEMRKI